MRTAMGWEWLAVARGPKHLELRLLINSHCPIISVESSEEDRFAAAWVAADNGVARGRHGAVQLRSAGTGAGEHGDDFGAMPSFC
jgi:hypothetical protein